MSKKPAASPARKAKGKAPVKPAAPKPGRERKAKASVVACTPAKAAKPKIGRPTLYRPEYCKLIVELGRKGKTKAQMASELDIARSTFDAWMDTHEEFADAWARADTHAKAYLEGLGEKAVFLGPRFNDRAWLAMLRARWPE